MIAQWIYRALLRLYPRDYTAAFADEMLAAFEKGWEERQRQGRAALARFALTEVAGLVTGVGAEWIARLTTDSSVRGRGLPDLRKMRPAGVPSELWFGAAGSNSPQSSLPLEVAQAQERVAFLVGGMVHAIANHDFQAARSYSYEEYRARDTLCSLRKKYGLDQ
ncbi:MAG TPA: hypothetical protein VI488_09220 [Candidatus Angelobacter sp.]